MKQGVLRQAGRLRGGGPLAGPCCARGTP